MDWILVTSILKKGLRSLKNRLFFFLFVLACLEGISPANRDITGPLNIKRSNENSQASSTFPSSAREQQVQKKGWGKCEGISFQKV